MEILLVGCNSHKLNLETNRMLFRKSSMSKALGSVNDTMIKCKKRICNRELLRNLTNLAPVIQNATRWSSKFCMLKKYLQIYEMLLKVTDSEGVRLSLERGKLFIEESEMYLKHLLNIDKAYKKL